MITNNHIDKLPNSPLQEVVFELFWELDNDINGVPTDPNYELALGVFAENIISYLPVYIKKENIISQDASINSFPIPKHQFWKGQNEWPVVQIGPGILVVNDVEINYSWKSFQGQIREAIDSLTSAYKKPLNFNLARLKYIDAYEIGDLKILDFINDNFTITLNNNFELDMQPEILNITQRFNMETLGKLDIHVSTGFKEPGKPSILWQSVFSCDGNFSSSEVKLWLDKAHEILSNQFKKLVKPDFYARFTKAKS